MMNTERTWAEIDLAAIRHNYECIRRAFGTVRVMTVMKADAYGHGIAGILPACDPFTDGYAAATVGEGAAIRRASDKPVLLFGPVPEGRMAEAAGLGLTLSVGSIPYAETLAAQLRAHGLRADVHLKLDTGFNRTGIRWREDGETEALQQILRIFRTDCFRVTGTYSHFACPESPDPDDRAFTALQADRFRAALEAMARLGLDPGVRHCCATGGALAHPELRMDMVRLGMMVYGQCDTLAHAQALGLRQAMCWKSRIVQVEPLRAGETVSYGRTFRAPQDMRLGVVSCGYADGYRRCYPAFGWALVCGRRIRTLGRVCMDFLLADLTEVPDAGVGTEVVLLGRQGTQEITAIEIAQAVESTCGEVTAALSARVPKYYLDRQEDNHV